MLLLPVFVVEISSRRKILFPFSRWTAVDMGAGGSYRITFTVTIIINTNHTYILYNIPVHRTIEGTPWRSLLSRCATSWKFAV
jgi:hypothetical protein